MKKILSLFILIVLSFSLASCSSSNVIDDKLGDIFIDFADAGYEVSAASSAEELESISNAYVKNSGIEEFRMLSHYLFLKEFEDGTHDAVYISKFGSPEQAEFYFNYTRVIYEDGGATLRVYKDYWYGWQSETAKEILAKYINVEQVIIH